MWFLLWGSAGECDNLCGVLHGQEELPEWEWKHGGKTPVISESRSHKWTMKLATVAFYVFALGLLAVGLRELLTGFEENRCSMTYMFEYPEYRVSSTANYFTLHLILYVTHTLACSMLYVLRGFWQKLNCVLLNGSFISTPRTYFFHPNRQHTFNLCQTKLFPESC